MEIPVSAYLGDGQLLPRTGNEYNLANMYETADGYAYLASYASNNIFGRLTSVLGRGDWVDDSRFADNESRAENSGIVEAVLVNWFLERTSEDASDELNEAGVPCAPVNTIAQSAVHPHVTEREIMIETPDDVAGTMWVTGRMIKFNRSGMPVGAAPTVGQHSGEILEELLGRDRDEVAILRAKNVI